MIRVNGKRTEEIKVFADDFNRRLEEAYKQFEENKLNKSEALKNEQKESLKNNDFLLNDDSSKKKKTLIINPKVFEPLVPWKPNGLSGKYFGMFKPLSHSYQMSPWEQSRMPLLQRSYEKEQNMLTGKAFICKNLYGSEFDKNPYKRLDKNFLADLNSEINEEIFCFRNKSLNKSINKMNDNNNNNNENDKEITLKKNVLNINLNSSNNRYNNVYNPSNVNSLNLSSLGKQIISTFVKDNLKREEDIKKKEEELYKIHHSKHPPKEYKDWKYSNHIMEEFSKFKVDDVLSYKPEKKPKKFISDEPWRIPKKDGTFFDKDIHLLGAEEA
jgi:hypothetical protein